MYRINLHIFGISVFVSLFDEAFQNLLSQRIFDLSDVAKDLWGVSMGLVVLNFLIEGCTFRTFFRDFRKPKFTAYFKHQESGLVLILLFSLCFLWVSSLLTDAKFVFFVFLVTIILFSVIFTIVHYFELKRKIRGRIILSSILLALVVSIFINHKKDFIFHNNFLTIYKGIPLPFFDVAFYPNHTFRFVDKKTEFNKTDKEKLLDYNPDILLIGAGENQEGGNGFPYNDKSHFIYNRKTNTPVQVMIFDSRTACVKYNELIKRGKRVLFVLHKSL
jgi:hypothetical protein